MYFSLSVLEQTSLEIPHQCLTELLCMCVCVCVQEKEEGLGALGAFHSGTPQMGYIFF